MSKHSRPAKQVLMAMMSGKRGENRSVIAHTEAAVKAANIERPVWLDAALLAPPLFKPGYGPPPPRISFPEDNLILEYRRRFPDSENEVISLSRKESAERTFALRQLEFMQRGMDKEKAFKEAAQERKEAQDQLSRSGATLLERQQQKEERFVEMSKTFWQQQRELDRDAELDADLNEKDRLRKLLLQSDEGDDDEVSQEKSIGGVEAMEQEYAAAMQLRREAEMAEEDEAVEESEGEEEEEEGTDSEGDEEDGEDVPRKKTR